jgi:hypothetical protein
MRMFGGALSGEAQNCVPLSSLCRQRHLGSRAGVSAMGAGFFPVEPMPIVLQAGWR